MSLPGTFIHEKAIVESKSIGQNTRIWAFAHVLPGAKIGDECNICDGVFVENDVSIGNRVTVKCGVQLWDGVVLADDVFIGPNVTFTNDRFPRSKQYPEKFLKTVVQKGASIGANATILPGITVGKNAMIGAGAVVTRDVPPNAIVVGNPAVVSGYVNSTTPEIKASAAPLTASSKWESNVKGVGLVRLSEVKDMRGNLAVLEHAKGLPFQPKRIFMVFDVPSKKVRGEHAHRKCHQFLICVKGSCSVVVDDGRNREEILLDDLSTGIHIPPMVWGVQYKYTPDAVLLVLASDPYDRNDYIRDYDEFLELVRT
ncbi:MAG TPA: WxcM-like domain-containing protein [Bdellovibrionota bacterium]|nr:WxcM-like domain-containing protein [Bdellovibrionota bacterium]